MLFHTLDFAFFFLVVLPAFLLTPPRFRWVILLVASLVFFGTLGAPALVVALAVVTLASYGVAYLLGTAHRRRGVWLSMGITFNVLVLATFKYLSAWGTGRSGDYGVLPLIGVSYFAFQGISYLVDVYVGTQERESHLGYFALYMAFFPKVLQGPIERAGDLLPQLKQRSEPDPEDWRRGAILFAWGLFKKLVVADRIAPLVESAYGSVTTHQGLPLVLATYSFALQLYCDFSGYTDMARGAARFFGVRLTQNFNNPYGARSVADFWRRWHISFSRWIFDYVFKPLQFALRDLRTTGAVIALMVTFAVSGLWHGLGWTFLTWGLIHGVYTSVSISTRSVRKAWHDRVWRGRPTLGRAWQVFATGHLVLASWVFFRAESLGDAVYVFTHLGAGVSGTRSWLLRDGVFNLLVMGLGSAAVIGIDMVRQGTRIERVLEQPVWFRWPAYYVLSTTILLFGAREQAPFIYFQF